MPGAWPKSLGPCSGGKMSKSLRLWVLGLFVVACAEPNVAPAIVGAASGGDAAVGDGALGDGSSSGAGDSAGATSGDGGTTADGVRGASDGRAVGSDVAPVADASPVNDATAVADAAPTVDAVGPGDTTLADGFVPPDIATAEVVYTADAPQSDGAIAKYQLCSSLLTCVWVACGGSTDPKCADICLGVASAAASAAVQPYLSCVNAYCVNGLCAGNPDKNCINQCAGQKCIFPAIACGADGKTGSADCVSAFGCMDTCKEKGPDCNYGCYGNLSKAAQTQFDTLFNCAAAAGGQDAFAACPGQALTCIAAGKTGSGGCAPLFSCMDGCEKLPENSKAGCMAGCWSSASPTSQQQWVAISKCLANPTQSCAATLATCAGPKGTKTCLDAVTCWGQCDKEGQKSECHFGCLAAASAVEANKAAELFMCIGTQCKTCKGDKNCESDCTKTKCGTVFASCLK